MKIHMFNKQKSINLLNFTTNSEKINQTSKIKLIFLNKHKLFKNYKMRLIKLNKWTSISTKKGLTWKVLASSTITLLHNLDQIFLLKL